MPQLLKPLRSRDGSALVTGLTFAIVMSIAGSALLMLSGNTVNSEEAALTDTRAALAVESGRQIGVRWLADVNNWQYYVVENPVSGTEIYSGEINGTPVTVTLNSSDGPPVITSSAVLTELGYTKTITCTVHKYNPGVFVNDFEPATPHGGLTAMWFDGPLHANSPIHLVAASTPGTKRGMVYVNNGPVTMFNSLEQVPISDGGTWGGYGTGPSGSNYDYGIFSENLSEGNDNGDALDSHFEMTYTHSQDSLFVPRLTGETYHMPQNNTYSWRSAVLYFDVNNGAGRVRYYYFKADETPAEGSPVEINNIETIEDLVIRIPNIVRVLGVVKGKVTVVTDPGCTIYPVGDLYYDGFSRNLTSEFITYSGVTNYNVGFVEDGSTNLLALVSGGNIQFNEGYQQVMPDETTGFLQNGPAGRIWVTAALIAAEPGCGIVWETIGLNSIDLDNFHYTLYAIGTRAVDWYFNYSGAAGDNYANLQFRFYCDRRMISDLQIPGFPGFRHFSCNNNELFYLKTDWHTEDVPIS